MDDAVLGKDRVTFSSTLQSSEIKLHTVNSLENTTPISKLCATMTVATLETPEGCSQEDVEPMLVETPLKESLQMHVETPLLRFGNKHIETVIQSPRSSPLDNIEKTLGKTSLDTPTTCERNIPEESPLCVALDKSFDLKYVNSTPRRNPRRSCLDKPPVKELDKEHSRPTSRQSVSKKKVSKSVSEPKIISCQNDNVPTISPHNNEDNDTSSILNKSDVLQEEIISEVPCSGKNLCVDTGVNNLMNNSSRWNFPLQINKGLVNTVSSEPRCFRKSDTAINSARRLSFSAKKPANKRKNKVLEYDPDNDIFAQGVMPFQFNVDSLKQEIGKCFTASNIPSPFSNKSRSCGALNEIRDATPIKRVTTVSPRKKQSTQMTPSCKGLKRTTSAPEILEATEKETTLNVKGTTEGTIRAFLRARDIIKNLKQRAKNVCSTSNKEVKNTLHPESASANSRQHCSGNVFCSNEVATSSENTKILARRECMQDQMNHNFEDSDLPPTQPFESLILRGVTAYVEVISKNENISPGVRTELAKLGATVVTSFNKNVPVTHVVFNDGHISTYKKAKKRNIPLVSVLWIEECRKAGVKVHESLFPPYQIEKYESPSVVKELKKRRIMRFYSDEKPKASPRRKKGEAKCATVLPMNETPPPKSNEKRSSRKSKWIDEVAGENGMVRLLVNMTGINHKEFKDLVNRPPTPDSDLDVDQNSPLPVRLLRKLAQDLPVKDNIQNSATISNDKIASSPQHTNPTSENPFVAKLNKVLEIEKERIPENEIEKAKNISTVSMQLKKTDTSQQMCQAESSKLLNISERKRVSKRKLLSPAEETIIVSNDVEMVDVEKTVVENPHAHTPKRLSKESVGKKRKSDIVQEEKSKNINTEVKTEEVISDPNNCCESNSGGPIRRSRRSSMYFVKAKQRCLSPIVQKPGLVCTSLHSADLELVTTIVEKLGTYVVEKNVTSHTTHIITGAPRRTMKILKGMARGCWIVDRAWILKSLEENKWLDEEEFELTSFSPAVQKYRLEKLSFGGIFKADIFSTCGPIFVSSKSRAPRGDIVELILLCGGRITSRISNAEIVVGKNHPGLVCVTDLWVLDSIQFYCCKSCEPYLCP